MIINRFPGPTVTVLFKALFYLAPLIYDAIVSGKRTINVKVDISLVNFYIFARLERYPRPVDVRDVHTV